MTAQRVGGCTPFGQVGGKGLPNGVAGGGFVEGFCTDMVSDPKRRTGQMDPGSH
jgi:hypothetical protein